MRDLEMLKFEEETCKASFEKVKKLSLSIFLNL